MTRTDRLLSRLRPTRRELSWGAILVVAEFVLVATYALQPRVTVTQPLILVLPFVWINLGLWAVARTSPIPSGRRARLVALGVGVGYFVVLAYVGGLVGVGGSGTGFDVRLATLPPGWGPIVSYQGALVGVTILPYKLIGYLALAYLVYATALEASSALVGGVVGLFSCVSCTFPVIAAVLSGVAGSGTALAAFAYGNSYLLSTAVFGLTVGVLVARPFAARRAGTAT